uniref:NADH-ubiquinone oxidoreductase chain 1 n=1 Tax=Pseudocalotes microlepis TaxID=1963763 RepID=A0A384TLK9_9SAUR|nr:NADH dehydrogenase subunit 1 [Pseudocalotes microlepis]AQU64354.1 NADH dehydrogenase subunit 1 [Pseudocalotes microlepis]QGN66997.1 NADH dehydrogenase subunit 1 [Pseudocalotes microlepis]
MHTPLMMNLVTMIASTMMAVAFLTLLERKMMGAAQLRKGPNTVGPMGLLQPMADGMKLLVKEQTTPTPASPMMFITAPTLALTLALIVWTPLPMPNPLMNMNLGLLFLMALSSTAVYTILWSGWASNSKYALMGALRAVAQTISYEVTLGLILMCLASQAGGYTLQLFSTTQESTWMMTTSWPLMLMWYISTIAETNRAPFDLTEGESELVSGFNVEYSGGMFTLLFLAEYSNILMMNTLSAILFMSPKLQENQTTFTLNLMTKALLLTMGFVWIRTSYPRFRYDQLMHLIWKQFLPMTLAMCLLSTTLLLSTTSIPPNNYT